METFERLPHISAKIDEFVEWIEKSQKILVTMHCRPDGDAAGSAIAFMHILRSMGKDVVAFNVDEIPCQFSFLNGAECVVHDISDCAIDIDLCVVLDCADPGLLGRKFPFDKLHCPYAYVDHHAVSYDKCVVNVHDSKASAVGEIIYHIMCRLGVELTIDIAAALYTSIITDTGSFRYTSTSADCLRISSILVAQGIDVWDICSHIYEDNLAEKVRLLGYVLQTLWISKNGKLAALHANRSMLRKCHCSGAMTDGFINYARSIHGVEVSIFLTQLEDDLYRLSFRSRGYIDVSLIAASFGGGGHKNAAACTLRGSVESIRDQVETILKDQLKD